MTKKPDGHEPVRDGFERTFVVDLAPEEVWRAVARPVAAADQAEGADAEQQFHLPGFEARCTALELDPGRLLRVRKDEQPCAGTEIAVRLEHAGSGTRVTVVQSGFGPWLADVIETFGMVWNMIVADLKLYIERGITLKTHLFSEPQPTANLGCTLEDGFTGLVVVNVNDDGFAARAGIQPGDLLVKLNGVRLLNGMQLLDLMRMCKAGDEVNAVWARGRERMERTAAI